MRVHGTSRFVAAFVAGQRAAERSLCRACSSREGRSGPLARAGLLLPRRCGREGAGRPPPREKAAALIYEVLASTKNEVLRRGQDTGAAARGWSRKGRGGPSLNGDQEIETVIKEKRCGPAPAPADGWGRPAGGERSAHHPARPQPSPTGPPCGLWGARRLEGWEGATGTQVAGTWGHPPMGRGAECVSRPASR